MLRFLVALPLHRHTVIHASEYLSSHPQSYAKPGLAATPFDDPRLNLAWVQALLSRHDA
jgi:hypothetical protein